MGHAAHFATLEPARPLVRRPLGTGGGAPRFESLVVSRPESHAGRRGATVTVSLIVHAVLLVAVVLAPLALEPVLPSPDSALRAFFVTPVEVPPPPPPPPPAAGVRPRATPAVPRPAQAAVFTAPLEIPPEVKPEEGLDLGVEGGVPGGVEGGVPGGVVGGVIGGLPEAPPPPRIVRVGGNIVAPTVVHQVAPVYPEIARNARLTAQVLLEATVDERGLVRELRVLQSSPLFDEAALAAVKQWRYQPLLLNGQPTPFLLSVVVRFNIKTLAQS